MANVDGTNRKAVIEVKRPHKFHPFGLSILGDHIYWTDWEESTLERAIKYTGEDRWVLVGHLDGLMSVQASMTHKKGHASSKPAKGLECEVNNGGCSHLCLTTPVGKKCACPDDYELNEKNLCIKPEAFLLYNRNGDINRSSLKPFNNNNPGLSLPMKGIVDASAIAGDFNEGMIYWIDIEEKTISRGLVNGNNRTVVVEFGLDFPDDLAIDPIANNIYWTDTGLNRIEVGKVDGNGNLVARRVLVWDNLVNPSSIAVDPSRGMMFWSAWGDPPVIETAGLDGSNRRIFVPDVGKANGLTIDLSTRRLYWTDLDKKQIAYATLDAQGYVRPVVTTTSNKLYGLTLYKDHIFWADWTSRVIEKANKMNGLERSIVMSDVDNVMDLMVFQDFNVSKDTYGYNEDEVKNPCAIDNGGCAELCLYNGREVSCQCSSHHQKLPDGECEGPQNFLLFGQKNKISRLVSHSNDVPDLVLSIQGARDIRSLSYDSVSKTIYWIDYGSKKHNRISINRAYDNGTLVRRTRLLPDVNWTRSESEIYFYLFHFLRIFKCDGACSCTSKD